MTQTPSHSVVLTALGRPNKRVLNKVATRQKVLDAARALFEAGTYEAATIREIATGAGMSTGAVFANFDNKADVWTAVYGGPPPSALIADEIARALGQMKGWAWTLSHLNGAFHVSLFAPDDVAQMRFDGADAFCGQGLTAADALRAARLAALADLAAPTHAVRHADDRAA